MKKTPKNISSANTLTTASRPLRILLAAGGTGGHVYPAISIADAIRDEEPDTRFLFAGTKTRMEWHTVPRYGYPIRSIWISGFHRQVTLRNLLFPLKLVVSLIQSFFMIRSFHPDAVIACGGFVSGPVGWIAAKMNIPLILQEQNSFPGVTTRMLGKDASVIFTAFEEAATFLPKEKIMLTGNPVRKKGRETAVDSALNHFQKELKTILILGGSGGAKAVNEALFFNLDRLHNELNLQILWQCGDKYFDELSRRVHQQSYPNLQMVPYLQNINSAYELADLVITRAGAGTCSELMNLGQPAVLIPSPNVAGNHQMKNAQALENAGAAVLLEEKEVKETLTEIIKEIITDQKKLDQMQREMIRLAKPDAAKNIAVEIINLAAKENK